MKKIFLVSDSPYATTGLGRMTKSFLKMLPEYEWIVWGNSHTKFIVDKGRWLPTYNQEDFPAKFTLLSPKSYSEYEYGWDVLPSIISEVKPDILLSSMDFQRIMNINTQLKQLQLQQGFQWINYFPVDRHDYSPLEVDGFRFPDTNVCITKFGRERLLQLDDKLDIEQIYHPFDLEEFPEVEDIDEFKKSLFTDAKAAKYLVGTVNRSFARKDTARLVTIFTEFLKRTKDTTAYIHGKSVTYEGTDLKALATHHEVPQGRMSFLPDSVNEIAGVSQEVLNKIYRSLDMFVTVSQGEGFGFTTIEALATGTPIIAPNNTCFPELVQDFGYLIDTNNVAYHSTSNFVQWPIVNIEDVVEKMLYVHEHQEEAKEKVAPARKWIEENLNLDVIADQWRKILES